MRYYYSNEDAIDFRKVKYIGSRRNVINPLTGAGYVDIAYYGTEGGSVIGRIWV